MFTTLVPAPIYTSGVCKRQFFFIDLLSNFRSTFLLFISSFEYLTPLWSAADVISLERAFLYLHSNMFLLIPDASGISSASCPDLHSNMFLLIQHQHTEIVHDLDKFTFQYVSINTYDMLTICLRCNFIYIPICFY